MSTRDLERLLGFYRDLLGFEVVLDFSWDATAESGSRVMEVPGTVGRAVLLRAANAFLELFEFQAPDPRPRPEGWRVVDHGITHICVEVDDLAVEYERLSAAGVRFHCPPESMGLGMRATYCRDPDENVVELLEVPAGDHKCGIGGTTVGRAAAVAAAAAAAAG